MVCRRSANTDESAPGSSRETCPMWRITFRSGIRPFLMSWFTWRATSPTVARRSASRTRAVLVRNRPARSPRSRASTPTSSLPASKSTSRRSRSSTAVFSASVASGRLMRDDTHTASTRATTLVPAAVIRNQESALRRSILRAVSGWVTRSRACTTSDGLSAAVRISGISNSPTATSSTSPALLEGTGTEDNTPPGWIREMTMVRSRASRATKASSTLTPPTIVNVCPPIWNDSPRTSAMNSPSAALTVLNTTPPDALDRAAVSSPSTRPCSFRKCPELMIWPAASCTCSIERPVSTHRGACVVE